MNQKVKINPGVAILSILPSLNYKAWFALAEFIDNSIQSYIENRKALEALEGGDFCLEIAIEIDQRSNSMKIRDNAAGIREKDYHRAFRPAAVPAKRDGLNEFGMGMKSAACWFAPKWTVTTKALGERREKTITFDVQKIVEDNIDELVITESQRSENDHYTEVYLEDVFDIPVRKTITKIKSHLTDIYRAFTRDGNIKIFLNDELLKFAEVRVMFQPTYDGNQNPISEEKLKWKKEIDFELGDGKRVTGFLALREQGNFKTNGLAIFRRNRIIVGSSDDPFKPEEIFGAANSFLSLRLFGELHIHGFQVSYSKDGIRWNDDLEEEFYKKIKNAAKSGDLNLLAQATNFSVKEQKKIDRKDAEKAAEEIEVIDEEEDSTKEIKGEEPPHISPEKEAEEPISKSLEIVQENGEPISVNISFNSNSTSSTWLTFKLPKPGAPDPWTIDAEINMQHGFSKKYVSLDGHDIALLARIIAAMSAGQIQWQNTAKFTPSQYMTELNKLIRRLT